MKVERSFSFAFRAPEAAKKLFIGGAVSTLFFTVFFAFVVAGYVMRVLCDVLEGRDARLPDWSDFRSLFFEGMEPVLVLLGYYSPVLVLYLVRIYVSVSGGDPGTDLLLIAPTAALQIIASMLVPAALIRLVVKGDIKAAFHFKEIFTFIGNNAGRYFVAWGLVFALKIVSVFCAVFFVVGFFFATFIASVISAHLYAQVYRTSKPFGDDPQGTIRGSMAIPPPLRD